MKTKEQTEAKTIIKMAKKIKNLTNALTETTAELKHVRENHPTKYDKSITEIYAEKILKEYSK